MEQFYTMGFIVRDEDDLFNVWIRFDYFKLEFRKVNLLIVICKIILKFRIFIDYVII